MNENQSYVRRIALALLENENTEIDEKIIFEKIQDAINVLKISFGKEEFNEVYNSLKEHFEVVMSIGQVICGDEIPDEWYTYVKMKVSLIKLLIA